MDILYFQGVRPFKPEVLKLLSYMELEDVKTTLSCEASLKK